MIPERCPVGFMAWRGVLFVCLACRGSLRFAVTISHASNCAGRQLCKGMIDSSSGRTDRGFREELEMMAYLCSLCRSGCEEWICGWSMMLHTELLHEDIIPLAHSDGLRGRACGDRAGIKAVGSGRVWL